MVFKIADIDYSDKVVMDTYDVNQMDIYTAWEDANGTMHRSVYRQKIQGQFDMQISKLSEYQQFIQDLNAAKLSSGAVELHLAVNNINQENRQGYFYVDYAPIRTRNSNYTKGYLTFTVTIEER